APARARLNRRACRAERPTRAHFWHLLGRSRRQALEASHREHRPSLEARPEPAPGVAAEVLVEPQQIAPVWGAGEAGVVAVARAASARVRDEETGEPAVDFGRDLAERHHAAGARRTLEAQPVAVEVCVALERLDEEIVRREPDRAAPVRVAAEEPGVRLSRRVPDAVLLAVEHQHERVLVVDSG